MYLPDAFTVTAPAEIDSLLSQARLFTLVTHGGQGLFASPLPMIHVPGSGLLKGHLARANPHRERADRGDQALLIAPLSDAYVSPSWYASKAEHGRVVPTWNYEAVQVYGRVSWIDDPAWLLELVTALTDRFEAGREAPWSVDDAPEAYVRGQLRGIVGVEVRIERIEAKRKLSQNRSAADRLGVASGLAASPDPLDRQVAEAMGERPAEA